MVKFDRYRCLRTDYLYNECSICSQICPEAVSFENNITVDESKLDTRVLGVCPAGSFSDEDYDPHLFTIKFANGEESVLDDNATVPLHTLTTEHLLTLILRKGKLTVNSDDPIVLDNLAKANAFLEEFGFTQRIETAEESVKSRRDFFKKVFKSVRQQDLELTSVYDYESRIPVGRQMLRNTLKEQLPNLTDTAGENSLLHSKSIEFAGCDNCGECIEFCPTQALRLSEDKTQIYFLQGDCIDCGICNHICHSDAIKDETRIDLVEFAFNKAKTLITHELIPCAECKTPFPRKGDERVCPRCNSFISEHSDLFTMARDI